MISDYKFQAADFDNQGVTDLPDRPNEAGMTAAQLKARFDNIPKIVMALGKLNGLMDYLASTGAAADIGATAVKAGGAEKLQEILEEIQTENASNTEASHTHENKTTLDELTDVVKAEYDRLVTLLTGMSDVATTLEDDPYKIPTSKAVLDAISFAGGGDMLKSIYDTNNSGKVDVAENAELLGGETPAYYATTDGMNSALSEIDTALTLKADKSTSVNKTLSAASWTGSTAPFSYSLTVTGVTSTSNQEILPSLTITAEQLTALQAANMQDGGQATNTIVLKAFGTKPTVDIPIRVILRGDM
jgi:hypothetical protein